MQKYILTDDLKTGNILIDSQHTAIFNAMNNLLEACSKGEGRKEITSTTAFLLSYVKKHFADEEALQIKIGYPDYTNHKKMHTDYIKNVEDVSKELVDNGTNIVILNKVTSTLMTWLTTHIKKQDALVANYIKVKSL